MASALPTVYDPPGEAGSFRKVARNFDKFGSQINAFNLAPGSRSHETRRSADTTANIKNIFRSGEIELAQNVLGCWTATNVKFVNGGEIVDGELAVGEASGGQSLVEPQPKIRDAVMAPNGMLDVIRHVGLRSRSPHRRSFYHRGPLIDRVRYRKFATAEAVTGATENPCGPSACSRTCADYERLSAECIG